MNPANEYLENRVMTATPEQLHLMVVDGAIRKAKQSHIAMEANDYEAAHYTLNESRDFVMEIITGMKYAGDSELILHLKSLFAFVYKRLVEADMERSLGHIAEALEVLEHHRDTWMRLCEEVQLQKKGATTHELNGPHGWVS
ncbi:Flagellar protein FliS [Polystyrenella longa]|uniref:Flagellar protein FliS n=1 Tax=Polystyrenella longa TaxID=2528007 RepID=A0A518CIX1_9PLAN|nr:flagellar export chaperone FliS [Polystyrenella longa]QDU79173.1 Flagellar protein FliS [Polystyrenella longa]